MLFQSRPYQSNVLREVKFLDQEKADKVLP